MIKNFEEETKPLTEYEETILLPVFVSALSKRKGKDAAITNAQIVRSLQERKYKISDTRTRKIINHIRINGLVDGIIATSDGYYVATSEQELLDYEESLEGRESAIRAVRLSMKKQRLKMFYKEPIQISIF